MSNNRKALDDLATKYVGDGKSNLIFVTDDDGVCCCFVGTEFIRDAKKIANEWPTPCWVEDKTGVAHDNAASRRRQAEDDD